MVGETAKPVRDSVTKDSTIIPSALPTKEVVCTNTNHGATDVDGDGCEAYWGNEHWCGDFDQPNRNGFEVSRG